MPQLLPNQFTPPPSGGATVTGPGPKKPGFLLSEYSRLGEDEFIRQAGAMKFGEKGFLLAQELAEGKMPEELQGGLK